MEIFSYKIFSSWLFYFMLGHFVLLVYLFWANLKLAWGEFCRIDKKIWLMLLIVFLFGFYLRNSEYFLGAHTDGFVAQEAAHFWTAQGQFVKGCALGNYQECKLFEQVLAPPGYPFLIVLADLIFGIHSLSASVISAILSSLTTLLVFLISFLLFKKEEAALYGALVFSLIPLNIINSQSGESRPTGLFFIGLAVLFYLLALKSNRFIAWLSAVVCTSYAIYVRQESYVLVPLFLMFFIVFKWPEIKDFFKKIKEKIFDLKPCFSGLFLGLVFLLLQLPVLRWLLVDNPHQRSGSTYSLSLDFKNIFITAKASLLLFFNLSAVKEAFFYYNLVAAVVFLGTFLWLLCRYRKKESFFILGLFLSYFFIYSLAFDGPFSGTGKLGGSHIRYIIMLHLPLAVIVGYGFYRLALFKKDISWGFYLLVIFLLLVFVNINFPGYRLSEPGSLPSFGVLKFAVRLNALPFYFPSYIFKDSRATRPGEACFMDPDPSFWSGLAKTPDDCLVVSRYNMIVLNDYFKNNRRKTALIEFIRKDNQGLFLNEFKKNQCLALIEDGSCPENFNKDNFACNFLSKVLVKTGFFSEDNRLTISRVSVRTGLQLPIKGADK